MERRKVTNAEVKKANRNRVFRYIRGHETVSNPDIACAMKISLPTATQITKELIESGLVEEKGELASTGGRRAKALSLAADFRFAAGLDITKNHIGMALINLSGEILKYERIYRPYASGEDYYRAVSGILEAFLDESGAEREKILGVGISFPGIIDLDGERISYSHVLGVENVPFESVSCFFRYPCFFMNDANAGAYAEGTGREKGAGEFFYLSLSNTVGGAFFRGNGLTQGKNFRCGEVGHMTLVPEGKCCYCGKKGCLDAYCSAAHLAEAAGGKLESFFDSLKNGEDAAVRIWEEYTSYLAVAVNNIHMVLDCDIVLGGYVGSHVQAYLEDIRAKAAGRNTFGEDGGFVKISRNKVEAAALGAALRVMEEFIRQV